MHSGCVEYRTARGRNFMKLIIAILTLALAGCIHLRT